MFKILLQSVSQIILVSTYHCSRYFPHQLSKIIVLVGGSVVARLSLIISSRDSGMSIRETNGQDFTEQDMNMGHHNKLVVVFSLVFLIRIGTTIPNQMTLSTDSTVDFVSVQDGFCKSSLNQ